MSILVVAALVVSGARADSLYYEDYASHAQNGFTFESKGFLDGKEIDRADELATYVTAPWFKVDSYVSRKTAQRRRLTEALKRLMAPGSTYRSAHGCVTTKTGSASSCSPAFDAASNATFDVASNVSCYVECSDLLAVAGYVPVVDSMIVFGNDATTCLVTGRRLNSTDLYWAHRGGRLDASTETLVEGDRYTLMVSLETAKLTEEYSCEAVDRTFHYSYPYVRPPKAHWTETTLAAVFFLAVFMSAAGGCGAYVFFNRPSTQN